MKKVIVFFVFLFFCTSFSESYAQCDFVGSWQKRLSNNTQYKWKFENAHQIVVIKSPSGDIASSSTINSIITDAASWAFGKWQTELAGTGITFQQNSSNPDIIIITKSTTGAMKTSFLSSEDEIAINYTHQYFSNDLTYANNNNYADMKANLLHEIGHVLLGLFNVDNTSSIMYAYPEERTFNTCDTERTLGMYNPLKEVTVKNSFGDGLMKIDYGSFITIPAAGKTVDDWRELSFPHSFTAKNDQQTSPPTFQQKFQDWTAPVTGSNLTISVQVPTSDNPLYKANFLPEYNITFTNHHSGGEAGGSIKLKIDNGDFANHTSPTSIILLVDGQQITGQAVNHSIDDVWFTFKYWSHGGSTNYQKTFEPDDNENYIAFFEGTPTNYYRNQHFNTKVVGQPIKVYWDQHPNTNVTKYAVYRKTRYGTEQLVKTVYRTGDTNHTYTYTDLDYSHTNDQSVSNQLRYDVRAYYSPDGNYSDPDFELVYGELLPKKAEGLDDEKIVIKKYEYGISNYPNPYNPTTIINYQIKEMGNVNITVYDALGREIKVLVNGTKQPGSYNVEFDGSKLSSGIYYYTMRVNDFMKTKKMLLAK